MMHFTAEQKALAAANQRSARAQSRSSNPGHQGRKLKSEGTRMACPHCDAQSLIRTSAVMSRTMRELTYACTNPECGHTFVAMTEIVRTLSPSATPNPAVRLPLSSHVQRDLLRIVLDHAAEAAHQARYTAPVTGDMFASGAPVDDTG